MCCRRFAFYQNSTAGDAGRWHDDEKCGINKTSRAMSDIEQRPSTSADALPVTGKRAWGFFHARYWLRDLVLSLLLAFIVIVFLYQPVQVEGTSMMPRLENHERIFINKFVYRLEPVKRGDIVVFWYPLDPSKSYIKRVIGLPGDGVSISNGRVYVNGRRLEEPYLPPEYVDHQSYPTAVVEPDHYYVLGDHR